MRKLLLAAALLIPLGAGLLRAQDYAFGTINSPSVASPLPFFGIRLVNATYARSITNVTTTGSQVDLYTVPTGKRAYIAYWTAYNYSGGGTATINAFAKISGTYYQLNSSALTPVDPGSAWGAFSGGNGSNLGWPPPWIYEAGETVAIQTNVQPVNFVLSIVLFDASTSNLRTVRLLSLASGDNTLYTVPAGKVAMLMPNPGQYNASATSGNVQSSIGYWNASGGSRTISINIVPSGGTVGATNKFGGGSVSSGPGGSLLFGPTTLTAGDFVNFNTNAATATQYAWVTVVEN